MAQISLNTSIVASLAEQSQVEGTGHDVPVLPPMIPRNLTAPDQARQQGAQRIVNQPLQQQAGQVVPNREGFFSMIARWFKESFDNSVGLPDTVSVRMPGGQTANFKGSELAPMIKALPPLQRAAARENLSTILSLRLENGRELLRNIKDGNQIGTATSLDVADLMFFISTATKVSGADFSSGAFSVEDPHGRLADFLYGCPEGYQRASSHMTGAQNVLIDGRVNVHRGIDIKQGLGGLPNGRGTLLFAGIQSESGTPNRLFFKLEWHGCRLGPLFGADRDPNALPDRPGRGKDWFETLGHALDFVQTRGTGNASGSRKEHIPAGVKHEYKNLLKSYEGTSFHHHLTRNKPTESGAGIRIMLANLKNLADAVKNNPGQLHAFKFQTQAFRDALSRLEEVNDLGTRIGNEVSRSVDDLINVTPFNPMTQAEKLQMINQKMGIA